VMDAYCLIPVAVCYVCFYVESGTKSRVVRVRAVRATVGSGGTALFILNLDTRWKLLANIMPPLLYLRTRTPLNSDWEAGLAPDPVRRFGEHNEFFVLAGIRPPNRPARGFQ
jgi:hypothetical protein